MENLLNNMTSCHVYVHLKPNFKMVKYLMCLNKNQHIAIFKIRYNIHVTGRFKNPIVERHKWFCTLCNENKLGDDYHMLFECTDENVALNRLKYISIFYLKRPSMLQCIM